MFRNHFFATVPAFQTRGPPRGFPAPTCRRESLSARPSLPRVIRRFRGYAYSQRTTLLCKSDRAQHVRRRPRWLQFRPPNPISKAGFCADPRRPIFWPVLCSFHRLHHCLFPACNQPTHQICRYGQTSAEHSEASNTAYPSARSPPPHKSAAPPTRHPSPQSHSTARAIAGNRATEPRAQSFRSLAVHQPDNFQ